MFLCFAFVSSVINLIYSKQLVYYIRVHKLKHLTYSVPMHTAISMLKTVRKLHSEIGPVNKPLNVKPGNNIGGSIIVPLTSCLTDLDQSVLQIQIVSCHTTDSKQVKQEVNGTVILPLVVFPGLTFKGLFTCPISECSLRTLLNIEIAVCIGPELVQIFPFSIPWSNRGVISTKTWHSIYFFGKTSKLKLKLKFRRK